MRAAEHELNTVLDIAISLSKENDGRRILNTILEHSMSLSNCDAGTLYVIENESLKFVLMKTLSMNINKGADGEEIQIPPVPMKKENICAYSAMTKQPISINDVYKSDNFDFSGPLRYDSMTGYHTGSMLSVPLINQNDEVIGVIQLINAMNEDGCICPFPNSIERIIFALSSLAAIELSNLQYVTEIKEQMWSFTEAMAEAIDNRTPYNANHIRNVAKYAGLMADYINSQYNEGLENEYFDAKRKDTLVMSALLHDIGKLVIPTKLMNKPSRLGEYEKDIEYRFSLLESKYKILFLENKISENDYKNKISQLKDLRELLDKVNNAGYIDDKTIEQLESAFKLKFEYDGECCPYFTEEEIKCLSIQKGTLTDEERKIMESHVVMTGRILEKVHFNSYFNNCKQFAVQHHEFLNGTGYPKKLTEKDLPIESRILAVADIYDALLATDRPYKKPMPREKAISILYDMASSGTLDEKLCRYIDNCTK